MPGGRNTSLTRTLRSILWSPEYVPFVAVGLGVAGLGRLMLGWLLVAGWIPGLANAVQLFVTLQLNFLGNRGLTWRRRASTGFWRSWRRFQVARGASSLLSLAAYPVIAPMVGASTAYWTLFTAAAIVNFGSDRMWSFAVTHRPVAQRPVAQRPVTHRPVARRPVAQRPVTDRAGAPGVGRRRRRSRAGNVLRAAAVAATIAAVALLHVDLFLTVMSVFMLTVAVTTLAFQLYKWWLPGHNDPERYGDPDEPRLPGVILVPMRHEEAVAGHTLERLATLNHPDYWVVPIVDHPDDPGTAAIAQEHARRRPGRVVVCPYPEDTDVHNKPTGLNAAVEMLYRMGIPFEWVGVADAEDLFHPDLLRMVDYRFRRAGASIVQCGVQLMNFSTHPRSLSMAARRRGTLSRWWRAHTSGWWRVANVLEYFKWFQSRLKLQAVTKVMPLGGNTVFFRREFLEELKARYGRYWDEDSLTEDCKIGILASVLGYRVDVVYLDAMVTREETPHSLPAFIRQRVRWMQGFIRVFFEWEWLALPTRGQRVLAVYVLGFQFFQAVAGLMAPIALVLALWHKSPILVALLATLPLGLNALTIVLDIVLLSQFGRAFGERVRLRDYASLVIGYYPYQLVLSIAAVWAMARFLLDRNNWVKTTHHGTHLAGPAPARATGPTAEEVPA